MIRKLIERPIAVSMIVVAILVLGIISSGLIPVSLMPDVDIPKITVQCSLPGASAREVESTVINPLKTQLSRTTSLSEIKCEAVNGSGTITMLFEHGAKIDYIFIEVNEKVDQSIELLPSGMSRPKIIKASASDIPVFFIDVTTQREDIASFVTLSSFVNEVIKKRLEQIPEVAMVDVSGGLSSMVVINPYIERLEAIGKTPEFISEVIQANNVNLGSLNIKDGYYRWSISFDKFIHSADDIGELVTNIDGRVYRLYDLAEIKLVPSNSSGIVRSDGKRALTMAVIKQSTARMDRLSESLESVIDNLESEYPDLSFKVSRDQTMLLSYSIGNLRDNIITGAILAIIIIFFFIRDVRSSMLIVITIPLSLVITLLLLYLLGISINVVSLSGMILGMGMIVDNSIIVIDNITQYRERGYGLKEAACKGAAEVITPMLSSVLTTCSVFVPLIFLSGMAGAMFFDQAMAVSVGLISSLLVSVLVIPVYYVFFFKKESDTLSRINKTLAGKSSFSAFEDRYESVLKWVFRHPRIVWSLFLLSVPLSFILYIALEKTQLPPLTRDDTLITVDWNEPLTVEESDRRICSVMGGESNEITYCGIMSGPQDFILSHTEELGSSQSRVYLKVSHSDSLKYVEGLVRERVFCSYPYASVSFSEPSNLFNMIFSDGNPDIVAMISSADGQAPSPERMLSIVNSIEDKIQDLNTEPVVWEEQIRLCADPEKMSLYGVGFHDIYKVLKQALSTNEVLTIKDGSAQVSVILTDGKGDENLLNRTVVGSVRTENNSYENVEVPLYELLQMQRVRDLKKITSGMHGEYYPVCVNLTDGMNAEVIMNSIEKALMEAGDYNVSFSGEWFESRAMVKELSFIIVISLLLLFFIMAAQFDSFIQPFIILSEIVVDFFGALFLLWVCGAGINIMSLIGIVVMSGIIINDSILKVDTINNMRKNGYGLLRSIMVAGRRRLKSILMTSMTTILGIAPFLVRGNMGADLQFPLSLTIIGGMVLGTLVSIFFIPLFYYEIYRRGEKHRMLKEATR